MANTYTITNKNLQEIKSTLNSLQEYIEENEGHIYFSDVMLGDVLSLKSIIKKCKKSEAQNETK
jgi:predicted transcriptional regulator